MNLKVAHGTNSSIDRFKGPVDYDTGKILLEVTGTVARILDYSPHKMQLKI